MEPGTQIGDVVRVFVYRDSEDRLIATNLEPLARVGQFAALSVRDVTTTGAYLDWGLEKDLLLPYRNQRRDLRPGERVTVFVYLDEASDRIVASAKWEWFLSDQPYPGKVGDAAELFVAEETDLGFKMLVDGTHQGLVYHNEVFKPLRLGDVLTGFVRTIRPDGKLDLSLQRPGYDEALAADRHPAGRPAPGPQRPAPPRRQKPGRRRVPPPGHEQESVQKSPRRPLQAGPGATGPRAHPAASSRGVTATLRTACRGRKISR